MEVERRVTRARNFEVRKTAGGLRFTGYSAVFGQLSDPIGGMFRERIAPGAFAQTIRTGDIRMLVNHNPDLLLARSKAGVGTLKLSEDAHGLLVEATMSDTSYARDLATVMREGNLDQMSFGFSKQKDSWDRSNPEMPIRTLEEVRLFDVSPVTFPAYPQTTAEVRALAAGRGGGDVERAAEQRQLRLAFLRRLIGA